MAGPDEEKNAFKIALDAAVREREELNVLIRHLARKAGVPVPDEAQSLEGNHNQPPAANADPVSLVAEGEFFGQSSTKAAKALLEKLGRTRPLKTNEIHEGVTKGGVQISKEVLYRSLMRSSEFMRIGRGTWGLSAWYPDRVRRQARADQQDDVAQVSETSEDWSGTTGGDESDE